MSVLPWLGGLVATGPKWSLRVAGADRASMIRSDSVGDSLTKEESGHGAIRTVPPQAPGRSASVAEVIVVRVSRGA